MTTLLAFFFFDGMSEETEVVPDNPWTPQSGASGTWSSQSTASDIWTPQSGAGGTWSGS